MPKQHRTKSRLFVACVIVLLTVFSGCDDADNTPSTTPTPTEPTPTPEPTPAVSFNRVISFGDSLSDLGTYTPVVAFIYGSPLSPDYDATWPPFSPGTPYPAGGRFLLNGADKKLWVEYLAEAYGLEIYPYIYGYNGIPIPPQICPKTPCFGFAQGGAKTTDPQGVNADQGALTYSLEKQITDYINAFQTFHSDDLILISMGSNDILGSVAAGLAAIDAEFWENRQDGQSIAEKTALRQSQEQALYENIRGELPTLTMDFIKQISILIDNGAKNIVVLSIPDLGSTPRGQFLPYDLKKPYDAEAAAALAFGRSGAPNGYRCNANCGETCICGQLSALAKKFNRLLQEQLATKAEVLWIDTDSVAQSLAANSTINFTDPFCRLDGLSQLALFCNEKTTQAGAAESYFYADELHPLAHVHKKLAEMVKTALEARQP